MGSAFVCESGYDPFVRLAEGHVSLLNGNLATKRDMAELEARLHARIKAVKSDLLKWMFGALIAQGGLIVALVKLL